MSHETGEREEGMSWLLTHDGLDVPTNAKQGQGGLVEGDHAGARTGRPSRLASK